MKEKLLGIFGTFGIVLYYIATLLISVLPVVMIGGNFFIRLLLIIISTMIPATSAIFWIWGLICAIGGIQDAWAIIYYIVFVVVWIPYYINVLSNLISKLRG